MQSLLTTRAPCDSFYIESSLPIGITVAEYRLSRRTHRSVWRRLKESQVAHTATFWHRLERRADQVTL
jgi:hypothetical protein